MLSYQPDSTELSPNVLTSVSQLLPDIDGSYRVPLAQTASSYAFNVAILVVLRLFLALKPDNTVRLFLTNSTKLWEADGVSSWTDRSAGGGSYTTDSVGFKFCQVGSTTVAVNKSNNAQYSNSGAFAQLVAIKAKVCATLDDRLLLANVDDGSSIPDGFMASDVGDITNFTPNPNDGTEAYQTTLTDCPGEITAMIVFRDFAVIFKKRGMWIAQVAGLPQIWDVRLVSANVGCIGVDACVVAGDRLYFMDDNDIYVFDGAQVQSIAASRNAKTIVNTIINSGTSADSIEFHHDDVKKLISIYYGSSSSGKADYFAFNYQSGQWGRGALSGNSALSRCILNAPNRALASLGGAPTLSGENRTYMNVNNALVNGHGVSVAGTAVTASFGDSIQAQLMRRVFFDASNSTGVSVAAVARRGPVSGATQQSSASASLDSSMKGDLLCRGHFFTLTYTIGTSATFSGWRDHRFDMKATGKN